MIAPPLRYRSYRWRGGDEWLAEIGEGPPVLIAPPLLEELNRCRAFLMAVMREVAGAGYTLVLPDLPGTGESPGDIAATGWHDWLGALGMLSRDLEEKAQAPLLLSFRGGCLVDGEVHAAARWRFAPVSGSALARDLVRARQAVLPQKVRAEAIVAEARARASEFAGYVLPPGLFAGLHDGQPTEVDAVRTIRLASDPAPADAKVDGRPLWRQAEPGTDPALSARLAADIVDWARTCAA